MTISCPSSAPLSNTTGVPVDGQSSQSAQERPTGKKKGKQKLWQLSSMEGMDYLVAKKKEAMAFAMQEERVMIEREKVELKRELEEERIKKINMSTLSYKQQRYYERHQDEILTNRSVNCKVSYIWLTCQCGFSLLKN
jgi:hypothetical protein